MRNGEHIKDPAWYPTDWHERYPWLFGRDERLHWPWRIVLVLVAAVAICLLGWLMANLMAAPFLLAALWEDLPGVADPEWHAPLIGLFEFLRSVAAWIFP